MAYLDVAPVLTRIRELLDDGYGALRTVASGSVDYGSYPDEDEGANALQSIVRPRVLVRITGAAPSEGAPGSVNGSFALWRIELTISAFYTLADEALSDAVHAVTYARAVQDVDAFAQALEEPANLQATEGGTPTRVIPGSVRALGGRQVADDIQTNLLAWEHRFTADIAVTMATT